MKWRLGILYSTKYRSWRYCILNVSCQIYAKNDDLKIMHSAAQKTVGLAEISPRSQTIDVS